MQSAKILRRRKNKNCSPFISDLPDLRSDKEVDEVFSGLVELYEMCAKHGAKVIALTVPETAQPPPLLAERRKMLNDLIRNRKRPNL